MKLQKAKVGLMCLNPGKNTDYSDKYTFNINPRLQLAKGLELSDRFTFRTRATREESYRYSGIGHGLVIQLIILQKYNTKTPGIM